MCLVSENGILYSVGRAYKRALELVARPQSTALHSTGNVSAEDSAHKNKVGHNSAHGIVSPLLFFPLKLLLHKVYISNILCGLRLSNQDIYSKEKPLFISIYNEHILDKTMVKMCGLTICLKGISPVANLLTLSIILTSSNECICAFYCSKHYI